MFLAMTSGFLDEIRVYFSFLNWFYVCCVDRKLLSENAAKMEQKDMKMEAEEIIHSPKGTPRMVKTVIQVSLSAAVSV